MSGEAWLYLLAVLINAVNLFLQVFFTIMYSDLEWLVPQKSLNPSVNVALLCSVFNGKEHSLRDSTSKLTATVITSTPLTFATASIHTSSLKLQFTAFSRFCS
jgi:hypothetical protein